jgi:predicted anti-sigma-YlaC factor YlaD
MDCATLRERVAPLLDGELEPDELDAAAEHLEACEDCAAFVERLAEMPVEIGEPVSPAQPDFWDAMDQALAAEATREPGPVVRARAWFRADLKITRGAALVYLLLLGLAFGWHLLRPDPTMVEVGWIQPEQAEAPSPTPAASPPPAHRSQKLEKASYAPVQQTF